RSEDGGQSWMDRSTGRLRAMGKVYCTSPDTAWATSFGAYDSIFQTTDGGLSWQGVLMPIREVWREMAWLNSQVGWVITGSGFDRGYVYHTTDGGQSWSLTQDAGIPLTSITAPLSDQELFWVTGSGGFIGQYDNSTLNLSLSPQDFNALSIYPNPSSGTVQIQPEQWQGQNGLMKLYDLQGNLLWQESWRSPRQQIDLAALPNALYLLHLQLGEQHYRQKLWLQR
ncbi:MAG: T9SS type A sorting domain-containing protein, partial [Bacteroidota bacterium]